MLPLKDHNPTCGIPLVTYALVILNTLLMFWLSALSPDAQQQFVIRHGFIPARIEQLASPHRTIRVPVATRLELREGRPVPVPARYVALPPETAAIFSSLVTCMFLHGGWVHLAGNMWFLWIFGNNIEDRLGHVLYLLFYLGGGLAATLCHLAYDPHSTTPVIGASGAVSAVLGAYAVTYPRASVSTLVFFGVITVVDVPALAWLGIWLFGQLVDAAFQRDLGVAVWAHIGGFAVGAVLMPLIKGLVAPPAVPHNPAEQVAPLWFVDPKEAAARARRR